MIAFFSILSILLIINAVLLVFSVNGAKESFRKPVRRITETSIPKLFLKESSETKYKKAV
ncbi:hypothetical protein [Flagellimonas meridianipacifica]|uniref:Uncharacterized protein n=1 Tax=Flagellimonas meridianipacifica TaxID=1080225 RepID=A0A2T0M995_9FLAO|nr:hypothetical protein [Allomuricauda pacifica]PRX54043.1 hypothetical protein CLV81_2439 [Allomuricauda pacifica]